MFLAVAALIGAYMAMNIGANDVANNVGPAVGSKALTLTTAIIIAAVFEAAGFDVVSWGTMGGIVAVIVYFLVKKRVNSNTTTLQNTKASVNTLFTIPLIFAAALLSFAHGANDVANAIGPLAAINDAVVNRGVSSSASHCG